MADQIGISSAPGAIRRRLVSSLGAQGFALLLRVGQQFVMVPLFIHAWGSGLYQDWLVISSLTGFLVLLDLGTQAYFGNRLLLFWSRGELNGFARTVKLALGCYAVICALALVLLSPVAAVFDWHALLGLRSMPRAMMGPSLAFLALANLPRLVWTFLLTIYSARGELGRGANAFSIFLVAQTAAIVAALAAGASPNGIAFITLLSDGLALIVVAGDQRRRYRDLRLGAALPNRAELRDIAAKSVFYLVNPLSTAALLQGPVVVLSALGTVPGGVVTFTVLRTLAGLARQLPFQLALGIGVEMSRHSARQDLVTLRRLYLNSGRFICGTIGLLAGMLLVIGAPFVKVWTHGQVAFDEVLVALFLAATCCAGPAQSAVSVMTYTNRPRPVALAQLCSAAAGLALCALLVPRFGIRGAAVALWLPETIAIGICLPYAARKEIGLPFGRFLAQSYAIGGLALAVSYGLADRLSALVDPATILGLAGLGSAWSAIIAALLALVFLGTSRRFQAGLVLVRRQGGVSKAGPP